MSDALPTEPSYHHAIAQLEDGLSDPTLGVLVEDSSLFRKLCLLLTTTRGGPSPVGHSMYFSQQSVLVFNTALISSDATSLRVS